MKFNNWEKRTLENIIDVYFPSDLGERLKTGGVESGTVERAEYLLEHYPMQVQLLFHIVVWVIYWSPLLFGVSFKPFNWLNWMERKNVFDKIYYNKIYIIRQLVALLKIVASISYFADEKVRREVGLPAIDDPVYSKNRGN